MHVTMMLLLLCAVPVLPHRYEELDRFELKRNRAIKVTRQLLQVSCVIHFDWLFTRLPLRISSFYFQVWC